MPSKRTSLALSLTGTPWMLRCGSYLWTWDYHGKRNKSTVLWKRLRIDIWGAIGVLFISDGMSSLCRVMLFAPLLIVTRSSLYSCF